MRVFVVRFLNHMVGEDVQVFWAALQRGEFITDAAAAAGTYRKQGTRWVLANGGVRPRRGRNLTGRYLSFAEREEIALARAAGESIRGIARRLGRSPATISRELRRNAGSVSGDQCARGGMGTRPPAQASEAGDESGAAAVGRTVFAVEVLAGADRRPVASEVP